LNDFHLKNRSAREIGLLQLSSVHPGRLSADELVDSIMRHGFTRNNAQKAITRLRKVVDGDPSGRLRLLRPGLMEAEQIMSRSQQRNQCRHSSDEEIRVSPLVSPG